MTIIELGIASFLGLWILASIAAQNSKWNLFRLDIFELLPNCRFFTPQPISCDIQVLAQAFNVLTQEPQPWLPLFSEERKWWNFLFCPSHRLNKAVGDLFSTLEGLASVQCQRHLSYAYLILLAAARGVVKVGPADTHFRFIVISYRGFEDPTMKIIFESNEHRL